MAKTSVVPILLQSALRNAGWFEGRNVAVNPEISATHPAHAVLAELGGVTWTEPSPRIRSLAFQLVTQEGLPSIAAWEKALATSFVGIAEEDGGHGDIYLSDGGLVVGCSNVHDARYLIGRTFLEAMEAIASGKRSKPMLLPDEKEVTLYGITFRQRDQEVIGPAELA